MISNRIKTRDASSSQNLWKRGLKLARKSPTIVVGLFIILIVLLCALLAPWLSPYDPTSTDLYARLSGPSADHLLGTDELGRDVLSRLIWGARVSLKVGLISVSLGMSVGVVVGVLAGYLGKQVDSVLMSLMDLLLTFPSILLAIAIIAALGPGITQVMIAVGIAIVPNFARVSRGSVISLKETDFVRSAEALGASKLRIMARHIAPNILTPIIVLATLNAAFAIIMEAGLSFLGIGVQPPDPTWGSILSDGRQTIRVAPWISLSAGTAISLTVLGLNMVGDGLRDLLDPKMRKGID